MNCRCLFRGLKGEWSFPISDILWKSPVPRGNSLRCLPNQIQVVPRLFQIQPIQVVGIIGKASTFILSKKLIRSRLGHNCRKESMSNVSFSALTDRQIYQWHSAQLAWSAKVLLESDAPYGLPSDWGQSLHSRVGFFITSSGE